MKRIKHKFELSVINAMQKKGHSWQSLADVVGIAAGCNLNGAVTRRALIDCKLIKLCKELNLNIAEMFLLKIERYEN